LPGTFPQEPPLIPTFPHSCPQAYARTPHRASSFCQLCSVSGRSVRTDHRPAERCRESSIEASSSLGALSAHSRFTARHPDAPLLRRPAARCATLAHEPCSTAQRPSAPRCSAPQSCRLASACPASRRQPLTAVETGLVVRDAPANSTGPSLSSPAGCARLRKERLAEMASRTAGSTRRERLRPAGQHSGSAIRSPTHQPATERCPAPFRTSDDPGHGSTTTTPLPSGALATRRPRQHRSFAGRGALLSRRKRLLELAISWILRAATEVHDDDRLATLSSRGARTSWSRATTGPRLCLEGGVKRLRAAGSRDLCRSNGPGSDR